MRSRGHKSRVGSLVVATFIASSASSLWARVEAPKKPMNELGEFVLDQEEFVPVFLDYETEVKDCLEKNEYHLQNGRIVFIKLGRVMDVNVASTALKHLKTFLTENKKMVPRLLDMMRDYKDETQSGLDLRKDLGNKIMEAIHLKGEDKPKVPNYDGRKVYTVKRKDLEVFPDRLDFKAYQFDSREAAEAAQQELIEKQQGYGEFLNDRFVKKMPQTMFSSVFKEVIDRSFVYAFEQTAALIPEDTSPFFTRIGDKAYYVIVKKRDGKTKVLQSALDAHGRITDAQLAQMIKLSPMPPRIGEPVIPDNKGRRFSDKLARMVGLAFEISIDALTGALFKESMSYLSEKGSLKKAGPVLVGGTEKDGTWEIVGQKKDKGQIFLALAKGLFIRESYKFVYGKVKKPIKSNIVKAYEKLFPEFDPKDLKPKAKSSERTVGVANIKGVYRWVYLPKDTILADNQG